MLNSSMGKESSIEQRPSEQFIEYIEELHSNTNMQLFSFLNKSMYTVDELMKILTPFNLINRNFNTYSRSYGSLDTDFIRAMLHIPWFRANINFFTMISNRKISMSSHPSSKECTTLYEKILSDNLNNRREYQRYMKALNFNYRDIDDHLFSYDEQMDILLNCLLKATKVQEI